MGTLITIGAIIYIIYLLYKFIFIRNEPLVQDFEIGVKSKHIYSDLNNYKLYSDRGIKFLQRAGNYLAQNDNVNSNTYYQMALEDFNKTIELNPEHAEAYYYKGLILWARNDNSGAYYTMLDAERLGEKRARQFIKDNGLE